MKQTPLPLSRPDDLARARRLALAAQGLHQTRPFGRGRMAASAAVEHLGYIQIDTISVVERAHHHVLFSRLPEFKPSMIHRLLRDRDIFEYWAHAAAFLPMRDFRYSLVYKKAIKSGQVHWYRSRDQRLMSDLMDRIRGDGPLRSRDVESGHSKGAGWWDWKPAKKALEQLYMEGELMVSDREGFQKTYDLTERVLPPGVDTRLPTHEEFAQHLLEQQLRCHGLVSLKGVTYLRRNAALRQAVKALVEERLSEGALEQLRLPGGAIFLIEAGAFERRLPRGNRRLAILSPFDNAVIQRDRLQALFSFDYQIECYLPDAKRAHGYFCLPLLYRDEFVGRMDCKAHRRERRLEIKALFLDEHKELAASGCEVASEDDFVDAFVAAVARFARFQQCDSVTLTRMRPSRLTRRLRAELKNLAVPSE